MYHQDRPIDRFNNVVSMQLLFIQIWKVIYLSSLIEWKKNFFFVLYTYEPLHMNLFMAKLNMESLWLNGRASELEIQRSEVRYLMRAHHVFFCPKIVTWPKNTIFLYCPNMFPSALTFRSRDVFFKGPCILDRSSGQESVPTKRLPRSPYKWHVQWFYTN